METKLELVSPLEHPNLYLKFMGSSTGFDHSFMRNAPVIETPVFRGHGAVEDESFDEDEEATEAIDTETQQSGPGHNRKMREIQLLRSQSQVTDSGHEQDDPEAQVKQKSKRKIRFEDEEERHYVSSTTDEDNAIGITDISQSETDWDGEDPNTHRWNQKTKSKTMFAAEYESSLEYAKMRREVITRLHSLGYVKEPRIFLSHADKLEMEKGPGKGSYRRIQSYDSGRVGAPPFMQDVRDPGETLKAPLIERTLGRTSLVPKKNKVTPFATKTFRPLPDEPKDDETVHRSGSSLFARFGNNLKKFFMMPFNKLNSRIKNYEISTNNNSAISQQ